MKTPKFILSEKLSLEIHNEIVTEINKILEKHEINPLLMLGALSQLYVDFLDKHLITEDTKKIAPDFHLRADNAKKSILAFLDMFFAKN